MKWKMMVRYLLSVIVTSIIVVLIVFLLVYFGLVHYNKDKDNDFKYMGVDGFVRTFAENIYFDDNNKPYISEEGVKQLKQYKAWIQILDEEGYDVYSKYKPSDTLEHYSPVEIVHAHKFTGVIEGYTVYVSMVENNNYKWSYVIGLPEKVVCKYTWNFYSNTVDIIGIIITNFDKIIFIIVLVTIIITIFIGYLFVKKLSKPLFSVIDEISELSKGNYKQFYNSKGVYKEIYDCMDRLSNNLKENERQREKLNNMREEWIENISHDLKTPLSSIKGYSELLYDDTCGLTNEEKKKYLRVIGEKSDYIEELLNDLRLTYQIKNDSSILNKENINIVDLTAEIIIDILNHPNYENRQINFNYKENYILCNVDVKLFRRAVNNIIYNSLKHNDKNTIINVNIYKDIKVHIDIEDNGRGISKEDMENLFERYYRGTNTGINHNGSGLGMAIARNIIESHYGSIDVESEEGEETKFRIRIPME